MDRVWMQDKLESYKSVCMRYAASVPIGGYVGDHRLREQMDFLEPTVKAILRVLDPELANFNSNSLGGEAEASRAATMGLGILADQNELTERLRPEGPVMSASGLHPWIWDAAATFWRAGKHVVAVEQAAKSLTAHTQQKTNLHLADDDLMSQVWSEDRPKPGRPRLRFSGARESETWKSRQRGARAFAQGCYAGIRNVAAHGHDLDWSEQVSLEYLASLSVLARWVEEAEVEVGD